MSSVQANPGIQAGGPALIGGFLTREALAVGLAMTALVGLLFHEFLSAQNAYSYTFPADWSHAYMVPFISAYLLWHKRHELVAARRETFWPALAIVVTAIACYVFFLVASATHMGRGWSMVLCIFGLTLFLGGPRIAQIAALPIAYLALGVTISNRVMDMFTWPLQIIGAQGADVLLNMCQVECHRSGNQLEIITSNGDKIPLNVAEACSGMRMVIAFIALGAAIALVAVKPWWQRVLLMMLGVPVAVAMNIVRVAVLGIASIYNPELSKGDFHMFIGTVLLVPGFFLFLGIVWALKKAVPDISDAQPKPGAGVEPTRIDPARRPSGWSLKSSAVVAGALMAVCGLGLSATVAALGLYLRKVPIEAPENRKLSAIAIDLPSWTRLGQDQQMPAESVDELGTSNYLSRLYVQKPESLAQGVTPKRMDVHMAYYTGMIDTVPHVPERCVVGAGWMISGESSDVPVHLDLSRWIQVSSLPAGMTGTVLMTREGVRLPRDLDRLNIRVTEFVGPEGRRLFAGYFFIANGGHVSSPEGVRTLAFNLNDKYAYYLKVQFSASEVKSREELAALAASWLNEGFGEVGKCVPDWIEVVEGRYPPNPRGTQAGGVRK